MELTDLAGGVIGENNILNLSNFSPEIVSKISGLIIVLKTAGIIFIGYLIFLIIKGILNYRRNKKISKMYYKINEIDKKLDVLLGEEKIKVHKKGNKKRKKK